MNKLLFYDVGLNDLGYKVKHHITIGYEGGKQRQKEVWSCPFYQCWRGMLKRSFCQRYKSKYPTYASSVCCEDWLIASSFKSWMEQQAWEGKQLDKDILFPDNKLYSPDTCAFVLPATNYFILTRGKVWNDYTLGTCFINKSGKYLSSVSNPISGLRERLGEFTEQQEAHEAWRKRKHELAQLVAATESDPRVTEALKKRYSYEEWYR